MLKNYVYNSVFNVCMCVYVENLVYIAFYRNIYYFNKNFSLSLFLSVC